MMIKSATGIDMPEELVGNYFHNLVGMYFKILPLYENSEKSLRLYMENLRDELEGCGRVIDAIDNDSMYLSLIATLQFLIDKLDDPECTNALYKRKVFGAISMCNKLSERFGVTK